MTYPGPNGRIVFSTWDYPPGTGSNIWTMNPDGTDRVNITSESAAIDATPDWSPDGSRIAFVSDRDDPEFEIYVMDADGSGVERLTTNGLQHGQPTWSPDGTEFLFRSTRTGNSDLFAMNADGSNVRQLTDGPATDWFASWSPDGKRIAFASTRSGAQALYLMPAEGGEAEQITPDELEANDPDFSPDGTKIVFVNNFTGVGSESDVFVLDLMTEQIDRLTSGIGNNLTPNWSPDGMKIIFMNMAIEHAGDGPAELFAINADGTGLANLTNTPEIREVGPRWGTALPIPA
jgi:Tol biopolymer transport system component